MLSMAWSCGMQVPRFTATLRDGVVTTPTSALSADQLFVQQQKALQEQEGGSAGQQSPGPTQSLLGANAATAPRTAKDALAAFTGAVKNALGTDAAGAELAAYLSATYSALLAPGASAATLRSVLGGMPSADAFGRLRSAFMDLQRARTSLKLPEDPAQGADARGNGAAPWQPAVPIVVEPPLSPRSAVLRLCDPSGRRHAALSAAFGLADSASDTPAHASAPVDIAAGLAATAANKSAASAAAAVADQHNAAFDPASDDEAAGVKRSKASLTWLQGIVCGISGQSPPSRGGDDTVLLLVMQVRCRFKRLVYEVDYGMHGKEAQWLRCCRHSCRRNIDTHGCSCTLAAVASHGLQSPATRLRECRCWSTSATRRQRLQSCLRSWALRTWRRSSALWQCAWCGASTSS